jgi:hypothetical protein
MTLDELLALPERFVDYSGPLGPKFRLSWACTSLCNADPKCPYCCTEYGRTLQNSSLPCDPDEYLRAMLQLGEDPGPFYAVTAWGDGMVNDQIARIIGQVARRNRVDITCNLVFPKERLKLMPTNGNLNFCASFHPHLWPSVEAFIEKAQWVIAEGFPIAVVGIVGYPPHMKHIERWVWEMRAVGLTANALRFGGEWNGKYYPPAYTQEETDLLLELNAEPESARAHLDLYLMSGSPRGRMCRAGKDYAWMQWGGQVHRCLSLYKDEESCLGSIFDGVTLLTEAKVCDADNCPCTDLWQYIEEGPSCAPSS